MKVQKSWCFFLRLLTCITEHLVLDNDLVAVQGLWVHFIVLILVGKVEQDLEMTKVLKYVQPKKLQLTSLSSKSEEN